MLCAERRVESRAIEPFKKVMYVVLYCFLKEESMLCIPDNLLMIQMFLSVVEEGINGKRAASQKVIKQIKNHMLSLLSQERGMWMPRVLGAIPLENSSLRARSIKFQFHFQRRDWNVLSSKHSAVLISWTWQRGFPSAHFLLELRNGNFGCDLNPSRTEVSCKRY